MLRATRKTRGTIRKYLRAKRIAHLRGERLNREWQAERAAFDRHLDTVVDRQWWADKAKEVFGER
jgi:hypothetical protein